jgi:hypothetical protein
VPTLAPVRRPLSVASTAWLFLLAFAGCATSVDRPSLSGFKHGLSTVESHSASRLREVNEICRRAQMERIEKLEGMVKETDVAPALDAESLASWNRALEALAAYASSLEVLSAPERGVEVEKSAIALGKRIHAMAPKEEPHAAAMGAAIGRLGNLIVTSWSNHAALDLMKRADPDVREVLTEMAAMLGDGTATAGVRATIWASWTALAAETRKGFLEAKGPEKRSIARRFAAALDKRAASDAALASVRKELLDLADAHTALSQGRVADALETIANIREQIQFSTALLKGVAETEEGEEK